MKRLVLLCDGNWLDAEAPARESTVLRLARAIAPDARDGTPQLCYYSPGVPSAACFAAGGPAALARSIDEEIQSLYRWLVFNWSPGDEIFLFGFSRGAYAVRCLAGMLRNAWLLHKRHEAMVPQAYHVYRTVWGPDADNALNFRAGVAREVRVRFLGAWDTVGERGIPLALFPGFDGERHVFHDTRLSRIVDHACHALAIDERRAALPPAPWHTRSDRTRTEQAWFAGSHADLGGGLREGGLAQLSLRWMVEQAAQAGLELERQSLAEILAGDAEAIVHGWIPPAQRALGTGWREIGATNADETLHASAEQRFMRDPGYRPRNLREYLAGDEQIRLPL
jgi:uncharacterized protein (DUF2235 family)